ncbi:MAG: hypothetical protein K8T89_21060, partial [Planctomycetes bacterium]|nr:hypothetical protein [Planctomycetota bacterium]
MAFVCAFGQKTHATNYVWDADGAGAGQGGTGDWNTSSALWFTSIYTTWPTIAGDNDAILAGTAGTLTLTTTIFVNDITVAPTINSVYVITGATQVLNLSGPTQSVIDVASTKTLNAFAIVSGYNGFTKTSSGNLTFDNGLSNLVGNITLSANSGTTQIGTSANPASSNQFLRSNAVSVDSGSTLVTAGATRDISLGSLSGTGAVTPSTGGTINIYALVDATFSGTITTTGGMNVRGSNGTTQTFNGNLTALTGTIGVNSGATVRLTGTGDSTSGVIGVSTLALRGGTITLDNSAGDTSAANGRVVDTASLTFAGGTLSLIGSSSGTTEIVGNINLNDGAATISVTNNGGTGTQLTITDSGSLRDSTKMTVNFVGIGGTLGSAGNNPRIAFSGSGVFTGTGGLFSNTLAATTIGWATVNGTEWAGINGSSAVVIVTPTLTAADNTTLQTATSTSITLFNPSSNQSLSGTVSTATLKITPTTTGLSLDLGSNNLSALAVMLAGTTDFTVSGTGQFANSTGTRYIYVSDANTT